MTWTVGTWLNLEKHLLKERGYIYSSKHEGWYSVSDETYYPNSGVHLIVEPATGRKIMACMPLPNTTNHSANRR